MPSVLIGVAQNVVADRSHPHMRIINERKQSITFPFAPKKVDHGGLSGTYTDTARPGRAPLLLRSGDPQPTMAFEVLIGAPYHQTSVEHIINQLKSIGGQRSRLTLTGMGPLEAAGPWRLTGLTISSTERQHGSNHITRATVNLTFGKAVDAATRVGPVSGGVGPVPGSATQTPGATGTSSGSGAGVAMPLRPGEKIFIVTTERSLTEVAIKVYGDQSMWRAIADRQTPPLRRASGLTRGARLIMPVEKPTGGGGGGNQR